MSRTAGGTAGGAQGRSSGTTFPEGGARRELLLFDAVFAITGRPEGVSAFADGRLPEHRHR
ncbi:hypothetical protein AB0L59_34695 [Streptomyces sp. NPDC052109]|uniref:hypothetical protein n=1 Tax=Streptomyces sp. NPDC052109 TaxID=3155527 RepID=UPI003422B974